MNVYQATAGSQLDTVTSTGNNEVKTVEWPQGARGVFLQAQGADVWLSWDGEDPDVSHKLVLVAAAGATFWPIKPAAESDGSRNIRWCSSHATTDATLDAVFVYD